jgi:hypothetical protein
VEIDLSVSSEETSRKSTDNGPFFLIVSRLDIAVTLYRKPIIYIDLKIKNFRA